MRRTKMKTRVISIILAVLMAVSGLVPAFSAFGAGGVISMHEIEIFYGETNTIVPTYIDDTVPEDEKQAYVEYMVEGQKLQLTYQLIDSEFPNNGYVKWYSETPTLVDVDQNGLVKAFDSSKGAVVHTWIDNEVKTIPLIGTIAATVIEKALFNEYVDVETMDTDEIVKIVEATLGEDSLIGQSIEGYKADLIESLRYYLDNINSNIHVQLFDAQGTLIDDDFVQICVRKNEEWYANFLPNGTHITNKSQINTTVAVGSTAQLYAITTPARLHYKTVYSVKSTSVFDQGKVIATVNDSGEVKFKNTGTVTIMVSPDTEEIIQKILEMVNYFYALENTGTINTDKIAGILIDYVGIDMNRTVLAGILDVCFAIKDIAGDAADPVQLTATAVEIISNLVLQFVYNDTITFTVVEAQPLTDFNIKGPTSVKEGTQIQLEIVDVQPSAGDTTDITWVSSDPSVASVDPVTGIVTGRDAGGSLGNLSKNTCTISAVSAANQIEKTYTITVTGKTGKYLSDVEIDGPEYLEIGQTADYTYSVYPKRVAESDSLYIEWGIVDGEDEEGNPVYLWADAENPVTDGIGTIDSKGHYTISSGGMCTIAVHAYTGYPLSNGDFYEISSYIATFEVKNGIPVEKIVVTALDGTSNGSLNRINTVTINDKEYTYVTIHKGALEGYAGNGAKLSAQVYPSNATNQNVTWVVDNGYYNTNVSEDTHSIEVKQKAGHETADMFNVYAVSADGSVISNVVTVAVVKNYVNSNVIDQESLETIIGEKVDATHTITLNGSNDGTYASLYKCNWYSGDESVFTVETKNNDNRDATVTGVDVGVATLYCVSADGGIVDTCQVTVYPDKDYLRNIVKLCDRTVIKRTAENASRYKTYMRKLDLAYTVLYDTPLASQAACDTYARELLYAFYNLGGFVGILGIDVLGTNNTPLDNNYVTIKVGSTTNYTKYSYDFDYKLYPSNAMYSSIVWTSSTDKIKVDNNGKCTPASNDPCAGIITCTVTDYMGTSISNSVYIAFSRTPATGVSLNTDRIEGGRIGETQQLTATVYPTGTAGVGDASNKQVYWTTSDENIATVDQNGVVTFKEGGDCTVYATTYDGGFTAQCAVNVVTNYTALQLLIAQYNDLQLNSVNYYPDTWETFTSAMAEAQAMLDEGGYSQSQVNAMYKKLESAYNGLKKYNYIQKVELYLDGEQTKDFYQYDLRILSEGFNYKNALLDLNVRIYPNNGSYASVEWASSTADIAVTTDGKCSPTSNKSCYGEITCTVTDHFGSTFSDSVWVSFSYNPVTGMDLSEDTISGPIGGTYQLTCTVLPTGTSLTHIGAADIQDYYWESDNEEIATIDQTGLVTFVSAGSTKVRAVSYDGGIYGECIVSSEGDRTQLMKALEDYKDIDYTDYEYNAGMAFKQAYENAQVALTDKSLSQNEIDEAAGALNIAASALENNPYIRVESVTVNYTNYKRPLTGSASSVKSGTVGSESAVSVDLSNNHSNYNDYNYTILNAIPAPSNSMYKSVSWSVIESHDSSISFDGSSVKVTPSERKTGAWAKLLVTVTDNYDRTTEREIFVVLSDNVCKGFDITDTTTQMYATASAKQLEYTISGSPEFSTVFWSSSDESVLTVDQNGVVTPVEKGEATITAKTLDGGFTDSIKIEVFTDFSTLASKQSQYYNLIESVKGEYEYTVETLDALSEVVNEAKTMIDEGKATQAQVNKMIIRLDNAYNSLVKYVPTTGVKIGWLEDGAVTGEKEGYIRYTASLLNGKTIQLIANEQPEKSVYTSITWESSNEKITIDENGRLTNNSVQAGATLVTCTVTNVHGESYSGTAYVSFVRYGATGVSFDSEMVYGAPAETVKLEPKVANSNNSNMSTAVVKTCTYSSSDESIATVDENGVVTFVSQGTAVITATTVDGGYSATINAFTTWDTTALKAAVEEGEKINYLDYAYAQGTAFNTALENAKTVLADIYSEQSVIDQACTALTEAMTNLEGNKFVVPVINISYNDAVINNGDIIQVDESNQAVISLALNDGAMVKSAQWDVTAVTGATAEINESNQLVVTKTGDTGRVSVTVNVVDDYDRPYTKSYTFSVIDQIIVATDFEIIVDNEVVGSTLVHSCGGSYNNFAGIQLGYNVVPENCNAISSVTYSSSASNYVTVSTDGLVTLTTVGKIRSSNTADITVTITNLDGSTISKTFKLTITKA